MPEVFNQWVEFVKNIPVLPCGSILQNATVSKLSKEEMAAYDAPFPDVNYQAGAKIFPSLVPATPDDPGGRTQPSGMGKSSYNLNCLFLHYLAIVILL